MITLPSELNVVISEVKIPVNPQYYITDNSFKKTVSAIFRGIPKPLILWSGADYDTVGNWTQEQADARILELLGSNPAEAFKPLTIP
jgi:hypothetical protein